MNENEKSSDEDVSGNDGGIKSIVPGMNDYVTYKGAQVKFQKFALVGFVETATKNLFDLENGITTAKWNKGFFNRYLFENIPGSPGFLKLRQIYENWRVRKCGKRCQKLRGKSREKRFFYSRFSHEDDRLPLCGKPSVLHADTTIRYRPSLI